MILQELCKLYDRFAADSAYDIAPPGFFVQGVAFEVVIDLQGQLIAINDLRDASTKPAKSKRLILPGAAKSGGSGLNPCLYGWDRSDYMLGYLNPEALAPDERDKKLARCIETHQAFKTAMQARRAKVGTPDFEAFCRFLEVWTPSDAAQHPILAEISNLVGVVRLQGQTQFLHENPAVHAECLGNSAAPDGVCLITGQPDKIARIHEIKIKGVNGAQSAGAAIISFNLGAFSSYGKEQSYNAPVGESSTFKYTTALNKILERDFGHRLQVGDTTVAFWAEQPSIVEDLFGFVMSEHPKAEDTGRVKELEQTFRKVKQGEVKIPDTGVGFHVLGLAPNAARLSIRFYYAGTVDEMMTRILRHVQDLEMCGSAREHTHLPLWLLLAQTARETKDIAPLLGGAMLRAILMGTPYPTAFYSAILRRIQADHLLEHPRAAAIKAFLNRNYKKEIPVSLDEKRPETAYQLGRLFACLERAQEDALPGLNSTIKDRYFSAASSTPAIVFPRLIRMSQHHLGKLEGGIKVVAEKRVQQIVGCLTGFPAHLGLVDQGLFAIGYYHQRQAFFTKKTETISE